MSSDSDRSPGSQPPLRSERFLPGDLVAVVAAVVVTGVVVFAPVLNGTLLRVLVGLPFVLFVPGYALVAALFPERASDSTRGAPADGDGTTARDRRFVRPRLPDGRSITGIERVVVSFGTSVTVVVLSGFALDVSPWSIRLGSVFLTLAGLTLLWTGVAVRRRRAVPPEEQFRVPFPAWSTAGKTQLLEPETRVDLLLNVLLVVSVVVAAASGTYAVAVSDDGEGFTELYLPAANETAGGGVDYPVEFRRGESESLRIAITNRERQRLSYAVVVELQRTAVADGTVEVLESERLRRLEVTLGQNETWNRSVSVTPNASGRHLRLAVLLYRDGVPERPTVDNAYRELHLWVDVTADANATQNRFRESEDASAVRTIAT